MDTHWIISLIYTHNCIKFASSYIACTTPQNRIVFFPNFGAPTLIYWSARIRQMSLPVSKSASIFWPLIDTSFTYFFPALHVTILTSFIAFARLSHLDAKCSCSPHCKHFGPCVFVGQSLVTWSDSPQMKHFFLCSLFLSLLPLFLPGLLVPSSPSLLPLFASSFLSHFYLLESYFQLFSGCRTADSRLVSDYSIRNTVDNVPH